MPRLNPLIGLMAAALGVLLALGIRDASAEEVECVSIDKLLAHAEEVSTKHKGLPFAFKPAKRDGQNMVWIYFATAPVGLYFHWEEGQCKAASMHLPPPMMRIQLGEEKFQALVEEYKAWAMAAKGTGI